MSDIGLRQQLYEWHLRLARAFLDLTPEQNVSFEVWQERYPGAAPISGQDGRRSSGSVRSRGLCWRFRGRKPHEASEPISCGAKAEERKPE
jgi:hypothetical protein